VASPTDWVVLAGGQTFFLADQPAAESKAALLGGRALPAREVFKEYWEWWAGCDSPCLMWRHEERTLANAIAAKLKWLRLDADRTAERLAALQNEIKAVEAYRVFVLPLVPRVP
jgi:hypothetical protein